jgi:hypothetical protein
MNTMATKQVTISAVSAADNIFINRCMGGIS